jgi:hypothetical protein
MASDDIIRIERDICRNVVFVLPKVYEDGTPKVMPSAEVHEGK